LSAVLQDATSAQHPLMITFLDLKNAFGSISHQLLFDMLEAVEVSSTILSYVKSFYSKLFVSSNTGRPCQFHFFKVSFKEILCPP